MRLAGSFAMENWLHTCLGLALLAACSIVDPNYIAAEGTALSPASVLPGTGAIRSVSVVHGSQAAPDSASAGSSADRTVYRLYVDMDSGRTQTVDVQGPRFMAGQRVEIASNGRVVGF
jgi:hypothetical protein